MQLCKTKPTKTNLTIQTYRTKHTEPKLLDQTEVREPFNNYLADFAPFC